MTFVHNCTTWWQLGFISKEDICVTLCQLLVEVGRAGLSQTPSTARTAVSSICRTSVPTTRGGLVIS